MRIMSTFTVGCSLSPPSLKRVSVFPPPPSFPVAVCFRPRHSLSLLKTGVGFLSTSWNPNRKQWIIKAAAAAAAEEEEEVEEEIEDIEEIGESEEIEEEDIEEEDIEEEEEEEEIGESEEIEEEEEEEDIEEEEEPTISKKKLKLMLKTPKKQRLVLKFIWMEKNIGLALDQAIPGHGTVPLTPYYFWPRKDAWEELKAALESKPWISQKRTIILLNQATDIINLWQQSGSNI